MKEVEHSISAPRGFRAAGVACGIKSLGGPDLMLLVSDLERTTVAGLLTQSSVNSAPIRLCFQRLPPGRARAVVVNSGNANAVTGPQGDADAAEMTALAARVLGLADEEVLVASTGVIGHALPMERVRAGIADAATQLSAVGGDAAARAIMTTDTRPKQIAVEVEIEGRPVRVGGIAKGAGMIAPRVGPPPAAHATMLAFLTTDAAVPAPLLQETLATVADRTLNCVTIDSDTSTNDTVLLFANGASGVIIPPGTATAREFEAALEHVCRHLARELARDGEGATKLVELQVTRAPSDEDARTIARSIAESPLVKTALFGKDPNWGRVLMAAGKTGVAFDQHKVALRFGPVELVRDGAPVPNVAAEAAAYLGQPEVTIALDLNAGPGAVTFWTCDYSYDYIRINAEYHT